MIAIIPPDELEGLSNRWRVSAQQEAISWQELLREFGVFIALTPVADHLGQPVGLSLRKQVRERRLVEGALSTQLKFIADLVDGTPHPIYARDQDGRLLLCNSSYASFFGEPQSPDCWVQVWMKIRKRWPFLAPLIADLSFSREARLAQEGDHRLVMATGVVDVYHWVQPYYDLDGNVQGGLRLDRCERARAFAG